MSVFNTVKNYIFNERERERERERESTINPAKVIGGGKTRTFSEKDVLSKKEKKKLRLRENTW